MTNTYGDVDASSNPQKAVEWQDYVDSWPQIRAYKDRVLDLLETAETVVDIGCGPGGDVVAIGRDRCIGIDRSLTMCTTASARGVAAIQADVHRLPLNDSSFDGVYTDRVIQHVEDPVQALNELVRVLRPGGRLVVVDPDQESLSIQIPGVEAEMLRRVKALRRDIGYRNGTFITSVPGRLSEMGFDDILVEAFPLVLSNADDAFGLKTWPKFWRSEGGFTQSDIERWCECCDAARNSGLIYSLTYLVINASHPGS